MGKMSNKKIFNVVTAGLTSAVLLGTSSGNSFAFDNTTAETPTINVPQTKENSRVVDRHKITLVTGDVVNVEKHSDGTQVATFAPNEDGTEVLYTQKTIDGDTYLIPDAATSFLAVGQMDEELFNISKLIEYGYDDAHQSSIPLIVTVESDKNSAVSEAAEEAVSTGAMNTVDLPSVDAIAVKTNKKQAENFWDAVDGEGITKQAQSELTEGIKKIWLDKPVHALLDKSVPQIGAPTAWASGYDGKGVKVAILDTGIDPNHPDVKNAIKGTKSFVEGEDFVDHHGHGTHVASTIAGSGAASDGKLKGVAPNADLIIGKVLSNEGSGTESGLIAGMEWAVQQKADIVSMSIGGNASDGNDPLSQAVNNLSATSDTLFVVAAGNSGSKKNTIDAPGAAEKALTVGAVDKTASEFLAAFSGRGPLLNNFRVKPDITAPGVGIVAARAAGTTMGTPVGANYTTASGTSMATPHVAGAAAILKQRHPDWTGDHIKQVLVDTGVLNTRYTPYQQGGGRVDIVKALDANVYSSPAVVSMGAAMRDDKPVEKSYKYVNPSDNDVTLNLAMTATGENLVAAPAGMFTLDKTTVTIPAHGSSEVKVTFNPALGNIQDYKVVVNATSSDSKTFKTIIGATKVEKLVRVKLRVLDRNGKNTIGDIIATNLDTGKVTTLLPALGQDYDTLLAPGHYSVMGNIKTVDLDANRIKDYTLAGEPMVELKENQDSIITLDARLGKEIKISTPKESEQFDWHIGYRRSMGKGTVDYLVGGSSAIWDHVYAVPTKPLKDGEGTFSFEFQQRRIAPVIKASYDGLGGSIPLEPVGFVPRLDGHRNLKAVNVGKGLPEDLSSKDISGKLAVITRDVNQTTVQQIKALEAAGAEAVVLVNDRPGMYAESVKRTDNIAIPAYTLEKDVGTTLLNRIANGPTLIDLRGIANSPYLYNISLSWPGVIPEDPSDEVTAENSAVVMNHYRGTKGKYIGETTNAIRPNEQMVTNVVKWVDTPLDREEWFSSGSKYPIMDQLRWIQMVFPNPKQIGQSVKDAMWNYLPGEKREQTWLGAAIGQSSYIGAWREGDKLFIGNHEFGDSEPTHWGDFLLPVDASKVRMFKDGTLIKEGGWFSISTPIATSTDLATYRVEMDTQQTAWSPLSTSSNIAFTFKSARPANGKEDLPLLWPKYDFKLDKENNAKGEITDRFDLSFVLQSGATPDMQGVEAEVSTDDGNTWSTAKVQKIEGGHYTVTLKNPASGYVSLRINGSDANGSKVEQTLIRAYGVR